MDTLTDSIAALQEQTALALVQEQLEAGHNGLEILDDCRAGMTIVGERFQAGEYFISELIYAGAIFKQIAQRVEPHLPAADGPHRGAVVIGTVKGDIHDIGKDLVVLLLKATGYKIHDLGVDVPAQRFVETLRETGATVLGLSALLTTSFPSIKATVETVDAAGLRPAARIMIGGGPVTEGVREYCGADAWAADAQDAVLFCKRWLGADDE